MDSDYDYDSDNGYNDYYEDSDNYVIHNNRRENEIIVLKDVFNPFVAIDEENALTCAICYDIAKPPLVELITCKHIFCKNCFNNLKQSSICPLCRQTNIGVKEPDKTIIDKANNVKVYCECCELWEGTYQKGIKEHVSCPMLLPKDKTVNQIVQSIKKYSDRINEIDLSNFGFADKDIEIISTSLQECRNLKVINLNGNIIEKAGIKAISYLFSKLPDLTELYLCNNGIDGSGAIILSEKISNCFKLKILDLKNNDINSVGVKAIISSLTKKISNRYINIKLELNGNSNIGNEGLKAIKDNNNEINKENLINIVYIEVGVNDINAFLSYSVDYLLSVTTIDFKNYIFSEKVVVQFKSVLTHCDNLSKIFLSRISISNKNVISIAKTLTRLKKLTTFSFKFNKTSNIGANAIVKALEGLENLTELDLSDNKISDLVIISDLLKNFKKLTVLKLSGNKISDDGGIAIFKVLPQVQNLRLLSLNGCDISDNSAFAIAELLQCFNGFLSLYLPNCIKDQGKKAIDNLPSVHNGSLIVYYI